MKHFLLYLSLFLFLSTSAQDTIQSRHFDWNLTAGGTLSSFQDLKYSSIHWRGVGYYGGMDFKWKKKGIHAIGLEYSQSTEMPKTFDGHGEYNVYRGQLFYYYVHPIKERKDCKLYLGAKIDGLDLVWHINQDLYNNASYLIYGYNFKAFSNYQRKINDDWTLNAQLGFQLFGIMEDGTSFAYAVSQETLENGDYNYDEMTLPVFFTPFWEYLSIETNFNFSYRKRWTFSYKWRMQQSYIVKNYRMTQGYSALAVSYSIISRDKTKK